MATTFGAATGTWNLVRIGGLSGILGSVLGLALVFAATVLSADFRWDSDALSDLGILDVAPIFNGAVILGGVLTIPFALGLRAWLPRTLLTNAGTIAVLIGGVSLALVGVFTLDTPGLHGAFALGYFVLVPVGLLLLGVGMKDRPLRSLAVGSGSAALVAILLLPIALAGAPVGFAVPEIIEAMILALWFVGTGAAMVRQGTW